MTTIHAHPGTGPSAGDPAAHGAAEHEHGHGHHYPFLQHHFDTPAQQFESGKLGMWLFLVTEVLFFGGLFVWYAVLRSRYPEIFSYASHYLSTMLGGVNTCVLILSSLTMALAVRCAQVNNRRGLIICLVLTLLGALGFLGIKAVEYSHKIHANLVWGPTFYEPATHAEAELLERPEPAPPPTPEASAAPVATAPGLPAVETSVIAPAARGPGGIVSVPPDSDHPAPVAEHLPPHLEDPNLPVNTHLFFGVYFAMTGLHGIHVLVGGIILTWLIIRAWRGHFSNQYYTPVDLGGLYWHIVDLIWIFLFPLFYIIH